MSEAVGAQRPSHDERFISALEHLVTNDDRVALAALRRGLGQRPGETMELYPYVVPYVHRLQYTSDENAYYIIASLVGLYPTPSWKRSDGKQLTNLGASLALLREGDTTRGDSLERRFVALLNAHADDLPEHLRQAISLLKSKDKPIDWLRLLRDLKQWGREDRRVQRLWAKGFWREAGEDGDASATQSDDMAVENA
jgi:CRISPR system Cascade subunit CasB